jgi:hypothetical protein
MALLRAFVIVSLSVLMAGQCIAEGDPLRVGGSVDRRVVAIGDTFSFHLDLDWQEGAEVKPLPVVDRIGNFIIRDIREGLATKSEGRLTKHISMLLTVFETGQQTIPAVDVFYLGPDGATKTASTAPIDIEVESVLPADASDIRDIKEPIEVPRRWKELALSYLLLVGLVAGTAVSVLFSLKRRQEIEVFLLKVWLRVTAPVRRLIDYILGLLGLIKRTSAVPAYDVEVTEPDLIPEEAALKELERIEALGLKAQGMIKDYYTLISETVRRYLERKYGMLAMESPVSYTLRAIAEMNISREASGAIADVLEEADLVKFAKFMPSQDLVDSLAGRARRIVVLTGRLAALTESGRGLQ